MRGRHGTKNTASKYIKKGMIPAEILVGLSCRLLTKRRTRKKKTCRPPDKHVKLHQFHQFSSSKASQYKGLKTTAINIKRQ